MKLAKFNDHFFLVKMIPPFWCWVRFFILFFVSLSLFLFGFYVTAHTLIVIAFVQLAGFTLAEFSKVLANFLKDSFGK